MFLRRVRRAHFGLGNELFAPLGLPLFALLLLRSRSHHRIGKVSWKGRTYAGGCSTGISPVTRASSTETLKMGEKPRI